MHKPCVADLLLVLKTEQRAIIAGQYAVLDELAPRKVMLFDQIQQTPIRDTDLRKIADILTQNKRLLAAAIKGMRAARDRIETLNKVRNGLQVYDRSGQFSTTLLQRPDVVKKA